MNTEVTVAKTSGDADILEFNRRMVAFQGELRELINRNCIDSVMGMHDFVLAEFMVEGLRTLRYVRKEEARLCADDKEVQPEFNFNDGEVYADRHDGSQSQKGQ